MSIEGLKNSTLDAYRLKNYQIRLEQQQELELKEIKNRHADELNRLIQNQTDQLEGLKHAYEVRFSDEMESFDTKLEEMRQAHQKKLLEEKTNEQEELDRLKTSHLSQMNEYKKNGAVLLESFHQQLRATSDAMHHQALKSASKERIG